MYTRILLQAAALTITTATAYAAPVYNLIDLGTLGGYHSAAYAINNVGQVAGMAYTADNQAHAFLYSNGVMKDLGTISAGRGSSAYGINDTGQVVGSSNIGGIPPQYAGQNYSFIYSNGVMNGIDQNLNKIAIDRESSASDINNYGQIVGSYTAQQRSDCLYTCLTTHAFLYSAGSLIDVGNYIGGAASTARGINDLGQITGSYRLLNGNQPGNFHAFIFSANSTIDLGTLGGRDSGATAINNAGQVVGTSYTTAGKQHAFLYSTGTMIDLGTLGGDASAAYGINNLGQVVGLSNSTPFGLGLPFLYSNGTMINLNSLIDPTSQWVIHEVNAINDAGDIAAYGCSTVIGECHALLLDYANTTTTSVPEPACFTLVSLGLASFYRRRRH